MPSEPTMKSLANKLAKMETKLTKCEMEIKESKSKLKTCTSELKDSKSKSIDNVSTKKLREKLKEKRSTKKDKPKGESKNEYMRKLDQARKSGQKQFTYTKKDGEKVTYFLDDRGFPKKKKQQRQTN